MHRNLGAPVLSPFRLASPLDADTQRDDLRTTPHNTKSGLRNGRPGGDQVHSVGLEGATSPPVWLFGHPTRRPRNGTRKAPRTEVQRANQEVTLRSLKRYQSSDFACSHQGRLIRGPSCPGVIHR